jgi:hypothetical protein
LVLAAPIEEDITGCLTSILLVAGPSLESRAMADQSSDPLVQALEDLGIDLEQVEAFLRGNAIVYPLPTESDPGIAMIQRVGNRLRSGIIEINDVGGGVKDFLLFRARSEVLARALGAMELELFGAAVINQKLETTLLRGGFVRAVDTVPEELGGGTMEILFKVFALIEGEE